MIDEVSIHVNGGDGGKGCSSFYTDKYLRPGKRGIGRPNGGDGGDGGDVILKADDKITTLLDFKFKQHFKAENGLNGSSKNQRGANGSDLILKVPVGTVVTDLDSNCIIRDFTVNNEEVLIVKGGRGGQGNDKGRIAKDPIPGESKRLMLQLKVLADVGIVGLPNAGKSTLITVLSNAKSKVANFPFTTKNPVLGIVEYEYKRFSIVDIPGLIRDSHKGKGLGDRFLRHVERTKLLLHIIDMGSAEVNPLDDYKTIEDELRFYSKDVAEKNRILVANKMDLECAKENLKAFKVSVKKKIYTISALNKEGLSDLIAAIIKKLEE